MTESVDILIVGGGPAGSALALALKNSPFSVRVLEAKTGEQHDPRLLAMSLGSKLILDGLGVWDEMAATGIEKIHVSQKGGFGRTLISAQDCGIDSLGYVLKYGELLRAMRNKLSCANISVVEGAKATQVDLQPSSASVEFDCNGESQRCAAKLLVLAEGGTLLSTIPGIEVKGHDYRQWAVVAQVKCDQAHGNVAFERFTPEGPVALLPFGEGYSLVWTASPEKAQELLALDEPVFLQKLQQHFGERAGKFVSMENRGAFELRLKHAEPITGKRLALIGNAAQTLHPVSGQGFNLGLRDAQSLAKTILQANEAGSPAMLAAHEKSRAADRRNAIGFTDSMISLFAGENELLQCGRGLGLTALDLLPPLRRGFARRMMFGIRA